jgi:hypothetical protein
MTAATPQQTVQDTDSQETREWMDALSAVIEKRDPSAPTSCWKACWKKPVSTASICRFRPHGLRQHH